MTAQATPIPEAPAFLSSDTLPKVIALGGKAGCGKSACAQYLMSEHGFVRHKFAGPLKSMLFALGLTEADVEHPDRKEIPHALLCGKSPRFAMQTLGTEWGRSFIHQDLWITLWMLMVHRTLAAGGRVVVDDMRFPNEAAAVRAAGGLLLEVVRPGSLDIAASAHASEQHVLPFQGTIINSGTLADLRVALEHAIFNQ